MILDLLRRLRPLQTIPIWVRYLCTAIIVLVFFAIRYAMEGIDAPQYLPLFLVFMPAVTLAAFLFNRGSGFFAVALSAVLGIYFFVEPTGQFRPGQVGEAIRLAFFVLVGGFTAALVEALRKTVENLEGIRVELDRSNRQRALLLEDINHRIKNHLASVAATISMSARGLRDAEARAALMAAVGRMGVLGKVYTRLHLDGSNVSLNAREFLTGLCDDLAQTVIDLRPITISCEIE